MDFNEIKSQWLLISDLDDTLIGDETALMILAQEIMKQRDGIILVYNSSRPCSSIRKSLENYPDLLNLNPDYLVGALGTEIEIGLRGEQIKEYSQFISKGWKREQISLLMEQIGLDPHSEEYQTPLKASYDLNDVDDYILVKDKLLEYGYQVKVIFSGGKNLDIIPKNSGKGAAIEFLRKFIGVIFNQTVVCGDSANDIDMFSKSAKGIVVGNADVELKRLKGPNIYHANNNYAAGVLEGLYYWGVISKS